MKIGELIATTRQNFTMIGRNTVAKKKTGYTKNMV
jgi:hypothetical protein